MNFNRWNCRKTFFLRFCSLQNKTKKKLYNRFENHFAIQWTINSYSIYSAETVFKWAYDLFFFILFWFAVCFLLQFRYCGWETKKVRPKLNLNEIKTKKKNSLKTGDVIAIILQWDFKSVCNIVVAWCWGRSCHFIHHFYVNRYLFDDQQIVWINLILFNQIAFHYLLFLLFVCVRVFIFLFTFIGKYGIFFFISRHW